MKVTHTENGLEVFSFAHPDFEGAQHGFFTRKGGVSHGFYQSLNLGGSIGDNPEHVLENKHRVMQAINRQPNSFYEVWQIHSTKVVHCDTPLAATSNRTKADGIFTSNAKVTLMMRFADCVPVIFYDPVAKVVGIVHAGWVGTVNRIVENAIKGAITQYGCKPENVIAGIGPSIGPDHYEVGADVVLKVKESFKKQADQILNIQNGRVYFDLWTANRLILSENGINRVHLSNLCTACDTENWYSHRAEKGKTGRFAAVIHLTQ